MTAGEPDELLVDQLLAAAFAPRPPARPEPPPRAALVEISPRYQLGGEIGRGGVGIVLRGRDVELNRDVAIKILRPEHKEHAGLTLRFVEEAQIGGQLEHPGVVPVHDMGRTSDGRPFFAMKLVQGRTFAELLKARRDPADERARSLAVFEQICQTIAYAHARGVIHRDLKPANVILGSFGEVQVADWGLAKVVGRPEAEARASPSPASAPTAILSASAVSTARSSSSELLSQAGAVLGTLAYMPPEQALGENDKVDERSDVFALGAMLCEILTGAPPYLGDTGEVLDQARAAGLGPAIARLRGCGADPELITLAERCLAAERDARPRGAEELARAIAGWRASQEKRAHDAELDAAAARARVVHERRVRKLTVALAATIVLASIGGGGVWLLRQSEERSRLESAARPVRAAISRASDLALSARRERPESVEPRKAALAAADGAVAAASAGDPGPELREEAAALQRDLAADLARAEAAAATRVRDDAMLRQLQFYAGKMGVWPPDELDVAFGDTFREWGLDFTTMSDDQVVARIRAATDPVSVCDFMLAWMGARAMVAGGRQEPRDFERMIRVMQAADPDPQRIRIRAAIPGGMDGLVAMAADPRILDSEERTVVFLGTMLGRAQFGDHRAAAMRLLREAADRFPDEYMIRLSLAGWLLEEGRGAEALAHATAASVIAPEFTSVWLLVGASRDAVGDFEGAVKAFDRGLALDPRARDAWYGKALSLLNEGAIDAARATVDEALAASPGADDLRRTRALVDLRAGELDAARARFVALLSAPGTTSEALSAADTLVSLGEAEAAEQGLRALLLQSRRTALTDTTSIRYRLVDALQAQERFDDAVTELRRTEQAVRTGEQPSPLQLQVIGLRERAEATAREFGALADDLDDYENGAREPASPVEATRVARLLARRGEAAFAAQLWRDALAQDEAAVVREQPLARVIAARVAIAAKEFEPALDLLERELKGLLVSQVAADPPRVRSRVELLLLDPALLPLRDPARRAALPPATAARAEILFAAVHSAMRRTRA